MKKMLLSSIAIVIACCITEIASAEEPPCVSGPQKICGRKIKEETNNTGGKNIWCNIEFEQHCYSWKPGPIDPSNAPASLAISHVVFTKNTFNSDFPFETRIISKVKNVRTGEVKEVEDIVRHQ